MKDIYKFTISYVLKNRTNNISFSKEFENDEFKITPFYSDEKISVKIFPKKPIQIKDFKFEKYFNYSKEDKFLVNGFQSWTDTREFSIGEKIIRFPLFAKILNPFFNFKQYGDLNIYKQKINSNEFYGFDFAYIKKDTYNYTFFVSQIPDFAYSIFLFSPLKNLFSISIDLESLIIEEPTTLMDVNILKGKFDIIQNYFSSISKNSNEETFIGWTSWYNYYQHINEEIILSNLNSFKEIFPIKSIFQIDDGYQTAVGDWLSIDKQKFPNELIPITEQIHSAQYKAGLWLAPFAAQKNSKLALENPDWILKDNLGNKVIAGSNWGGFYALDFLNPNVREYLKDVFNTIFNIWNFDLVKLDFLYAVAIIPQKNKTRATIMSEAMTFIRTLVGDKKILACGVPLAQSFNKVDFCRIGPDMGLNWNGKLYEKGLHREKVSTINSLKNSIYRHFLNQKVFINDPDVFLLRDENLSFSDEQKHTIYLINAIFGSLVFTSDDFSKYSENKLTLIKNLTFFIKAKVKHVNEYKGIIDFEFKISDKEFHGFTNFNSKKTSINHNYSNILDIFSLKTSNISKQSLNPYETAIFEK